MFKSIFISLCVLSIFIGCTNKEEKIIDYKEQQQNSKEALKDL